MGFDIVSSIITGVISPITNVVGGYLNKKQDVDLEKFKVDGKVDQSLIAAHIAELQAKKDILAISYQYKGDRLIRYGFEIPLIFWWADIFVYCMFHPYFPNMKPVLALPDPLNTWAGGIMSFIFLMSKITDWKRKT